MRFMLFIAGMVTIGAVGVSQGVFQVPPQMVQAFTALGGDPAHLKIVNANPAESYSRVLPQILKGSNPDAAGIRGSTVTSPPGNFRTMNSDAGAIGQNGAALSAASQIQQNNIRMQDAANYARNPSAWHGAPPR